MIDFPTFMCAPDTYLDARQPTWETFERDGAVRYDPVAKVVRVSAECHEIVHMLSRGA